MLTLETLLSLPESVAFQSLGESQQTVMVSMESGYLFTCNQTTRAFLEAVNGKRTLGQIIELLHDEFEVEPARLQSDMCSLAQRLLSEGLLVSGDAQADA